MHDTATGYCYWIATGYCYWIATGYCYWILLLDTTTGYCYWILLLDTAASVEYHHALHGFCDAAREGVCSRVELRGPTAGHAHTYGGN